MVFYYFIKLFLGVMDMDVLSEWTFNVFQSGEKAMMSYYDYQMIYPFCSIEVKDFSCLEYSDMKNRDTAPFQLNIDNLPHETNGYFFTFIEAI
ncbi:hypothetical protein [Sphingobacterium sp. 1.A.5]|uniref:hypothetical protein n=1 Tax=Sphingobacterium sp. 1.A.5 TaxID=2044604 RepID=UPI000C0BDE2F|nr:hypothetical protein [Sphingobacterium sp. 1.A.5]